MLFTMALLLPISAFADEELFSYGHFYYHDHDGYVSIAGYLGTETKVVIPSTIIGKPVAEIESGAFNGCHTIKQITVPDTVVMVYEDSFTGADSLERVISESPDVNYVPEPKTTTEAPQITTTTMTSPVTSADNSQTETDHSDTENETETLAVTDNSDDIVASAPDTTEQLSSENSEDPMTASESQITETYTETTISTRSVETAVPDEEKHTVSTLPIIIVGAAVAVGIVAGLLFLKRKD